MYKYMCKYKSALCIGWLKHGSQMDGEMDTHWRARTHTHIHAHALTRTHPVIIATGDEGMWEAVMDCRQWEKGREAERLDRVVSNRTREKRGGGGGGEKEERIEKIRNALLVEAKKNKTP